MTCPKLLGPPWSPDSNHTGFADILTDVTQLVEECQHAGWGKVGRASGDSM